MNNAVYSIGLLTSDDGLYIRTNDGTIHAKFKKCTESEWSDYVICGQYRFKASQLLLGNSDQLRDALACMGIDVDAIEASLPEPQPEDCDAIHEALAAELEDFDVCIQADGNLIYLTPKWGDDGVSSNLDMAADLAEVFFRTKGLRAERKVLKSINAAPPVKHIAFIVRGM